MLCSLCRDSAQSVFVRSTFVPLFFAFAIFSGGVIPSKGDSLASTVKEPLHFQSQPDYQMVQEMVQETVQDWYSQIDWSKVDTVWLFVADSRSMSGCSLARIELFLKEIGHQPRASLIGHLRPAEIEYWVDRQFGASHPLGDLIADAAAFGRLSHPAALCLYPVTSQGILPIPRMYHYSKASLETPPSSVESPILSDPPDQEPAVLLDSVDLDESAGPFSELSMVHPHPVLGLLVLDPHYRRLRVMDKATGSLLTDLDLDWPYESFYHRFKWPDTSGQSLLSWLDSDQFPSRSFLLAEGFRASLTNGLLYITHYRRYPHPEPDGQGGWITGLEPQGFLLVYDSAWNLVRQGLIHSLNLPEGHSFLSVSLLPFSLDSGWVALSDYRSGEFGLRNIGVYHVAEQQQVKITRTLDLPVPKWLEADQKGTHFAEPFLAGNGRNSVAGFRLYPAAKIFPSGISLQFPDTSTYLQSRLLSSMESIDERRIAWAIVAEYVDQQGWVWLVERRDQLPDQILVFDSEGHCRSIRTLPSAFDNLPVQLERGRLWAWARRGEHFRIYSMSLDND